MASTNSTTYTPSTKKGSLSLNNAEATRTLCSFLPLTLPSPHPKNYASWILTNSAQDYTPTLQDHSLNTYSITPHAAVKQPIYKNS